MMLGNEALLNCEKIGFLASWRVPPEAVMRCLDWATRMRDEGVCVMSGFQSPLEKEVLNILLKGTSPLILVLARRMWDERHIPTLFRKPLAEGRLLVVSPVSQSIRRVDAHSAAQRNRYILDRADRLFLISLVGFEWWGCGACPQGLRGRFAGPVPMLMLQKRTETVCFVKLFLR